ncbi:MAG: hypothetical protein M1383_05275 [Patescibacteria group bacterium]|nr:hypothetical protein [Patescibacteria group bacterium]
MPKNEPTISDVLEAVQVFSNKVEKRFDGLESRVTKIEQNMVTKDYLDEKLLDLKGDLTVLIKKEDRKLLALVSVLEKNKIISTKEAKDILSLEPFPQTP